METADKLKYFEDYVVNKAQTDAKKSLQLIDKAMDIKLQQALDQNQAALDQALEEELARLKSIRNKVLYTEKMNRNKAIVEFLNVHQQEILEETVSRLELYLDTEDYMAYLAEETASLDQTGNIIYLTPKDYKKKDQLPLKYAQVKEGDDFMGGYKVVRDNKILDNTFLTKLRRRHAYT